jgi:hypothetical protein
MADLSKSACYLLFDVRSYRVELCVNILVRKDVVVYTSS